ncbi:MAG: 30S ribosomal protein S20 [Rickettsiales bacterium]|nr:30S ribosomal protein S20 [Rickettsiales bacterium]
MANHKSSKKRILVTEKRRKVNIVRKNATRTEVKKAANAIASGDKAAAMEAVKKAESRLMKAAKKVMPKKRASRKVSRLVKAANKISK